jgi:hypothetical protein
MFFLPLLAFLAACKGKSGSGTPELTTVNVSEGGKLPGGFDAFYKQFHQDSAYQMAHIEWPLRGETDEAVDSAQYKRVLKIWQPGEWKIQRMTWNPQDYEQQFETMGEVLVVEKLRAKSVKYGLERRFSQNDQGQWMLIYYADLQNIQ